MEIKVFVRQDCPECVVAAHAYDGIADLSVYDLGDFEGLAAASAHSVRSAPTVLVVDSAGREIAAWRGEAPDPAAVRALLAN